MDGRLDGLTDSHSTLCCCCCCAICTRGPWSDDRRCIIVQGGLHDALLMTGLERHRRWNRGTHTVCGVGRRERPSSIPLWDGAEPLSSISQIFNLEQVYLCTLLTAKFTGQLPVLLRWKGGHTGR